MPASSRDAAAATGERRTIRTLVVATSRSLHHSLRNLLATVPAIEILALSAGYEETKRLARRLRPDLFIVAADLKELPLELSLLCYVVDSVPRSHVPVLFLPRQAVELVVSRPGRSDWSVSNLFAAFGKIGSSEGGSRGEDRPAQILTASLTKDAARQAVLSSLTRRESEVLRMAAEGMNSAETGHALGISSRTAECHRARLMRKLGLHRRADLVRFAVDAGVIGR